MKKASIRSSSTLPRYLNYFSPPVQYPAPPLLFIPSSPTGPGSSSNPSLQALFLVPDARVGHHFHLRRSTPLLHDTSGNESASYGTPPNGHQILARRRPVLATSQPHGGGCMKRARPQQEVGERARTCICVQSQGDHCSGNSILRRLSIGTKSTTGPCVCWCFCRTRGIGRLPYPRSPSSTLLGARAACSKQMQCNHHSALHRPGPVGQSEDACPSRGMRVWSTAPHPPEKQDSSSIPKLVMLLITASGAPSSRLSRFKSLTARRCAKIARQCIRLQSSGGTWIHRSRSAMSGSSYSRYACRCSRLANHHALPKVYAPQRQP
ncbi:hypothetical protein BU16DRAFT_580544 [Lophium mytilinum]|uniref:Uncharacterized protein n=1 Tax=Lophium mytilinum TaxID=390894 RepID=A0A6A6R0V5_9PEZI|nr:hypothetical protein BU16DRAFT_580544 [Lophium mytilinum]